MAERLISEAIKPVVATCDTDRMGRGEPGLPRQVRLARQDRRNYRCVACLAGKRPLPARQR